MFNENPFVSGADDDDGPDAKRAKTDSPAAGYSGTPPMMPVGPGMPPGMQRPPYGAPSAVPG